MYPPEFDRAVACANNPGLCNVDELLNLAQELETYEGCFFEEYESEECEQEKKDRVALAEFLFAEAEVQEHENIFKKDVKKEHDRQVWDKHQELMDEYSAY